MTDAKLIDKNGQWYLVSGDGQPLPGAEEPHVSREEAQAHLDALVQSDKPLDALAAPEAEDEDEDEEEEALEKADVSGQPKTVFIPLAKVDEQRREVWGYAAVEEPDNADEVMDYESSKPHWMEWSTSAQKRSGGRSLGNLRSMHKSIAAGKLIDFRADDQARGFFIGAEVIDDAEWRKVQAGVYTGFSVGGSYIRRWHDARLRKMRYTAKPVEVSLVDAPCIPSATFQVVKADGVTEERSFQPGNGENTLVAELEKLDAPGSPEATGSIDAEGTPVEKLPETDRPIPLNPDNPPTGDEIAARHGTRSLESAAAEASGTQVTSPEIKKIKVTPAERRLIKVVRAQNIELRRIKVK